MDNFKALKRNLKIVLWLDLLLWIGLNVIGGYLSFKFWPYFAVIFIFGSLIIAAFILKLYSKKFQERRNKVMLEAFNSFNHDNLTFSYYKQESYEAFDVLHLDNLAEDFDICQTISGTFNMVNVESYSALYSPDAKKKNMIILRIYIFDSYVNTSFRKEDIKSRLFKDATMGKYFKEQDNKFYIAYAYKNRDYNKSLEPMAYKKYDDFLDRYKLELEFIEEISNKLTL